MKFYHVVAALIRRGDEILLVQQQGPDDPAPSWSLPGGGLEAGETLTEALIREVREETGLAIVEIGRLLYVMQHNDIENEHQTFAFVFAVNIWKGNLQVDDPDNLILGAYFLSLTDAIARLESHLPIAPVRDPIVAHLRGEAAPGAVWVYQGDELFALHMAAVGEIHPEVELHPKL